jgi:hypothetical protein
VRCCSKILKTSKDNLQINVRAIFWGRHFMECVVQKKAKEWEEERYLYAYEAQRVDRGSRVDFNAAVFMTTAPFTFSRRHSRLHIAQSNSLRKMPEYLQHHPLSLLLRHLQHVSRCFMDTSVNAHWSGLTITTAPTSALTPYLLYACPWPSL